MPFGGGGSVSQTFHAPVTMNQAIATDSAVQRIGHLGDKTGSALKEISDLLQQSQDLTPRQVKQGVADVEAWRSKSRSPRRRGTGRARLRPKDLGRRRQGG
jgi:hypothetical protein